MKQTKICAAGLAAGCLSLAVLLGACAAGPAPVSEEVVSARPERIWTMDVSSGTPWYRALKDPNQKIHIGYAAPLPFVRRAAEADLCVTLRIRKLECVYYGIDAAAGTTVFSAELLETHRNTIGYTSDRILIQQLGTPQVPCGELFAPGDTLLVNLKRVPKPSEQETWQVQGETFVILNCAELGTVRLIGHQGEIYAIDLSITPYVLHPDAPLPVSVVDDKTLQAVRTAYFGDCALDARAYPYTQKDVFRYDDLVGAIRALPEANA